MYSEEEVRIFSAIPCKASSATNSLCYKLYSMEGNFFGYKLSLLNGLHPCSMQSFDAASPIEAQWASFWLHVTRAPCDSNEQTKIYRKDRPNINFDL